MTTLSKLWLFLVTLGGGLLLLALLVLLPELQRVRREDQTAGLHWPSGLRRCCWPSRRSGWSPPPPNWPAMRSCRPR